MRFLQLLSAIFGMAAWTTAQNVTCFNPQNATMYQLSGPPDDAEFGFLLQDIMTLAASEGSSTGEVLRMATQIVPGDFNSWYDVFFSFAQEIHALADSIDINADPVGKRESYFRAATYYRNSVSGLVGNASDPRLYSVWPPAQQTFLNAIQLLRPSPGESITLRAPNSSIGAFDIPGYFLKASPCEKKLPTIIVGTGYDGPMEELYHLACSQILKRGVNCVLYEGPGQPTPRRAGLGFITDWWSVLTPIVDYLYTRPDVDTSKIVLLGDSFGGLLAPIAASREHRLSAMVLNDGFCSLQQTLIQQFGPELEMLYNASLTNASYIPQYNEAIYSTLAENDTSLGSFVYIWDYSFWSLKEPTPFDAFKRLGDFYWGPEQAAMIGQLPVYVARGQDDSSTAGQPQLARKYLTENRPNGTSLTYYHVFLTALGAGEHTSIGAESQVFISVFGWLSSIWGNYSFPITGPY